MDMLRAAADKVSKTVDSVADTVKDAAISSVGFAAFTKVAENEIKKYTGSDIDVEIGTVASEHNEWVLKTGINSICNADTWDFLEDSEYNKPKVALWKERGIKKIILAVEEKPEEDMVSWTVAWVDWRQGSSEMKIRFYPRALRWVSSNSWVESGSKSWWILRDEIVFGLQLYQLPGKCFYKSDWLDGFEDVDPAGLLPSSTKKVKRWFQFRHWVIMWFEQAQPGWNYQYTQKPPKNPDGTDFSLSSVLSLPSMPDLKMPSITLPSLPNIEMPSLPSLPSIEAPSLSAPSLSMPSLGSLPSLGDKPKRPSNKWAAHGIIELKGLNAKAKGKLLVLSDATLTNFYEDKVGRITDEKKEHQRLELMTVSDEQATSWLESLKESGVKEGEVGGCCTVA